MPTRAPGTISITGDLDLAAPTMTAPESRRFDDHIRRAHNLGLSAAGLNRLRSLVAEHGRTSWQIGDFLIHVYGAPAEHGYHDGTRALFADLADEVGVTVSMLVHARLTAGAWPLKERRSVAFSVHRDLRALPDRFALLAAFMRDCQRAGVTPSSDRLPAWLHAHASRAVSLRPRLDPVDRIAKAALALDVDALTRLIDRLTAALAAAVAA